MKKLPRGAGACARSHTGRSAALPCGASGVGRKSGERSAGGTSIGRRCSGFAGVDEERCRLAFGESVGNAREMPAQLVEKLAAGERCGDLIRGREDGKSGAEAVLLEERADLFGRERIFENQYKFIHREDPPCFSAFVFGGWNRIAMDVFSQSSDCDSVCGLDVVNRNGSDFEAFKLADICR